MVKISFPMAFSICLTQRLRARFLARAGLAMLVMLFAGGCGKSGPAAPVIPANATPEEHAIILARAALGPDDKLTAINTLVLAGTMTDGKNQALGQVVLLFKKPARQRSEIRAPDQSVIIQGSDGVEGWFLSIDKNNNKTISVLKSPQEMQNIYMTMENLYFYRATERIQGASVTMDGETQYHDFPCWKVSFHYPDNFTYVRYIDRVNGQLHGSVIEPIGAEFIEEGQKIVNGVNFPVILRNYKKDGQLDQTIKFNNIIINQPLDDRLFDMPSLMDLYKTSAPPKAAATANPSPAASPAPAAAAPTGSSPLLVPALAPPLTPN
jgi:outer membrane lipoprotein-sorting protein